MFKVVECLNYSILMGHLEVSFHSSIEMFSQPFSIKQLVSFEVHPHLRRYHSIVTTDHACLHTLKSAKRTSFISLLRGKGVVRRQQLAAEVPFARCQAV